LRDEETIYETYWTTGRGNEVMAPSYGLLDLTVYGRQEVWEYSPEGWPQRWDSNGGQMRLDGRPTAQWSRLAAGRSDDLGAGATATVPHVDKMSRESGSSWFAPTSALPAKRSSSLL
jgi:hypothetical protein